MEGWAGDSTCHIDRYGSAGWRDWNGISGTALINLGIHAEGQQSQDRLFLYNAGTDSLYLSDFPQSRYFDFSYAPSFDTNTDEKMQPGSCVAVDIVDKKNLPAGNYGNCKNKPCNRKTCC